jgi:hypothetical protein
MRLVPTKQKALLVDWLIVPFVRGNSWIVLHAGEFELTSLKHQYEGLVPGKSLEMPEKLKVGQAHYQNKKD